MNANDKVFFTIFCTIFFIVFTSLKLTRPMSDIYVAYPKPRSERLLMRSASTATKYSSF